MDSFKYTKICAALSLPILSVEAEGNISGFGPFLEPQHEEVEACSVEVGWRVALEQLVEKRLIYHLSVIVHFKFSLAVTHMT